ncbi:hypothetical protein FGA12_03110 [Shewanella marisflavi]|uniref:Uncharacterized protein n=2 Tax=Shewanellaceae TaxID=267890 RepID=A0AAC9U1V6_9GAMM|nr:hypothetical protein CFF01_03180 [Shewanella marisflavi]QDF74233.1 hypothetical protein FGA12_03110 [Shewanella marisflavi]
MLAFPKEALKMQTQVLNNGLLSFDDRRVSQAHANEHWDRLTTAQRFAFYTLAKLGYQLLFVRQTPTMSTAIAKQEDQLATIDDDGDIDFNPDIVLRERRPPRKQ